jgi:hypothetical protein
LTPLPPIVGPQTPAAAGTAKEAYRAQLNQEPQHRVRSGRGPARRAGILAARHGDGYQTDIGFTMPPPAPGVWQLPAGQTPLTPWISTMPPFLLAAPDQFRPGPPPALTSRAWSREFNEVKAVGGATSTVRTPDQTMIARVWGGLHYRGSTLVGSRLGDQVARWDLLHGPFRTTDGGLDPHH